MEGLRVLNRQTNVQIAMAPSSKQKHSRAGGGENHSISAPTAPSMKTGTTSSDGVQEDYEESRRLLSTSYYKDGKEIATLDCSSMLSAYLKFGCISVREAYWIATSSRLSADYMNCVHYGLWLGEFFKTLGWHYPTLFGREPTDLPVPPRQEFIMYEKDKDREFLEKIHSREFFSDVHWVRDYNGHNRLKYQLTWCPRVLQGVDYFALWCEGRTGFRSWMQVCGS